MDNSFIPYFQNNAGFDQISIGAKEFMCIGASAPHEHPYIFLNMGEENKIVCPYCSTLFRFDCHLGLTESIPDGCLIEM
ncbi:zinc-finger domain-containing protein [Candidatus Endowatersipora endosymbiont of Watersipora subatra]|uniref:zinc-finger domain-containing protein n=1 Tax=Candidatus Endowatersipora endosymbiont of Watersipora subatra TaxID=3077946 RepID=UPI00312CA479